MGRIHDEFPVHLSDPDGGDGSREGDVGDAKGGGGPVDAENVGIIDAVGTEQEGDDLGVVEVAFGEKRTEGTVRHAAGEDLFLGGAPLTLEVASGEAAGGGGLFLVFDGKREEILAFLDLGGGDGGDENDRIGHLHGDGAIGQFGQFARLDDHFLRADLARDAVNTHVFSSSG